MTEREKQMTYILKHFDHELLTFLMRNDPIEGLDVRIVSVNEKHAHLLPIDLEADNAGLQTWLRRRVIPGNRAFVESFLTKIGLNPKDVKGIIDYCKGLSLNDCYWVVHEEFEGAFEKYNLYENPISRVLSLIAFTGHGETRARAFASTPELTTGGMLPKCWRRISGQLSLYKGGTSGGANTGKEPYSEYYATQVGQAMGLPVVAYDLKQWKGQLFSVCELFCSKQIAYVSAGSVVRDGGWKAMLAWYRDLGEPFHEALLDMLILDAVICNEDRHFGNFGLLVDSETNRIIRPAPLFDHGISLFNAALDDDLDDPLAYGAMRRMRMGQDFLEFSARIINHRQKQMLRQLFNFTFHKHSRYNLPDQRLKRIELFIRQRAQALVRL